MTTRIHLVTGVLIRNGKLLMVANRYPNHVDLLWNLPGGRQEHGELLAAALVREVAEETGLAVSVGELLYASESYDRSTATHFANFTFRIEAAGEPHAAQGDAHVVAVEWVPIEHVGERLRVGVVREPLVAYLAGSAKRYWGYEDAGITIEFADENRPTPPASPNP